MTSTIYTTEQLLQPVDFGNPVRINKIFNYITSYDAANLSWYQDVTVLSHIANVALFSKIIAERIEQNSRNIDVPRTITLAWLRDIGRVPWGLAEKYHFCEITQKYVHHGFLGYNLLMKSQVPQDLSIISMTHVGSGISASETKEVNKILGRDILPVQDWYAKTIEEKVVVIADKIPGWNNTILKPWNVNNDQDEKGIDPKQRKGNKIYSWVSDQTPLWQRFWQFKKQVDQACGIDVLTLFDPGLLISSPESFRSLPTPEEIMGLR